MGTIQKEMKFALFLLSALLIANTLATCEISKNGRCGTDHNNTYCGPGAFCSRYGWCGVGSAWSAHSAQSRFDGRAACVQAQQRPATRVVVLHHGSRVMDVWRNHFAENQAVILWSPNGGENQRFSQVFV